MKHFFQRIPFAVELEAPREDTTGVHAQGILGLEHGEVVLRYEFLKHAPDLRSTTPMAALIEDPGSLVAPGFSFVESLLSRLEESFESSGFPDVRETRIALEALEDVSVRTEGAAPQIELTLKPQPDGSDDTAALSPSGKLLLRISDEYAKIAEAFAAQARALRNGGATRR
ncbi:MAG: hypothetical protein ACOC92_00675 [bacterium]